MVKHYITLAFRNLLRNKFQSIFSIVGLAVAFFCFGLFAYFVHALTSPNDWAADHDHMVKLTDQYYLRSTLDINAEELEQIEALPEAGRICSINFDQYEYFKYEHDEDYHDLQIPCIKTDTTFHQMFNPRLIAGSWNDVLMSENSFAMCESCAIRCFGSTEAAIGQTLISNQFSYVVRAVIEDLPQSNTIAFMVNVGGLIFNDIKERDSIKMYYIEVQEGYNSEQLKTAINNLGLVHSSPYFVNDGIKAVKPTIILPICEESLGSKASHWFGYSLISLFIMLPGLLILLSALSNFFHLLLSNIMMRRREYVLRRAHGAHTWHLWLMVSTQVIVMMLLVGFFSLIVVEIAAPFLQFHVANYLSIVLDAHLMFVQNIEHIGILLIIGLVVAWLVVARIRRDSLQEAMKTSTGTRPSRHIMRNILLCWQLVVGYLFITILAAVYLQLGQNQRSILPQFSKTDKENTLLFNIEPGENNEYANILEAELSASPDVECFTTSEKHSPAKGGWKEYIINELGDTLMISYMRMSQKQFEFLGIPLLSGKWAQQENEAVADPDFLEQYHLELGDQITVANHYFHYNEQGKKEEVYQNNTYTITGVVDCRMTDFNQNMTGGLKSDPGIFTYHSYNYYYWVKCSPGSVDKVKRTITNALDNVGLGMDMHFDTLKNNIDHEFEGLSQFIPIFWLFCLIALSIALLGIYSAITVDTTYRRKEMAIRKINGAKARHIAMLFARLYVRLLAIAAAIAFPLAYILIDEIVTNNFMTTFNHGIGFYLGIFLLVATFVTLTIGVQIWKISRIEPASVVKAE
ncbi:MAG: FtsX-like permease family protein [Bacteroidales bacterium]|nr:FtsX-like permease family protein [Bacteroidales bacterium]